MNSINNIYLDYVDKVIHTGHIHYKDNNDKLIENIGNYYYIDDPLGLKYREKYRHYTDFDLLTDIQDNVYDLKGCPIKSDALYEYVDSFNDCSNKGFVYSYPNRILAYFGVNQFKVMMKRLLRNLGSNRSVCVTFDPCVDHRREDIPCLQLIQFLIRDGVLDLHCFFRSNDVYGAFYSNMYFLTYVGLMMKEELNKRLLHDNLVFGGLHYYCSSGHVYGNDLKASKYLLRCNR